MDLYVRTLRTVNQDFDEAVESCAKLIIWLHGSYFDETTELKYIDLETMCKAVMYLNDCFALHGVEPLQQAMLEKYPTDQLSLDAYYQQQISGNHIEKLCARILKTQNHRAHIPTLVYMLELLGDIQPVWRKFDLEKAAPVTAELSANSSKYANHNNRSRMLRFVQRIFQLPQQQIEIATQRMLTHLSFDVLAQVLLLSAEDVMYNKCCVLVHIACQQLLGNGSNCVPPESFLHNIYTCAADSHRGLLLFWQCLEREPFSHSLRKYLLRYIGAHIMAVQMDELQLEMPFLGALCLVQYMLHHQSPCRQEFFSELHVEKYAKKLFELLNKLAFVYN